MDGESMASRAHPEPSLSGAELWKAQFTYVSGTIIAWGAVMLQLWPVLSRMQTGTHIHAFGRDVGGSVPATSYYLLALLVAVGVGMALFGSIHLIARGFWFAHLLIHSGAGAAAPAGERVARSTYIVLHVLWGTALLVLCAVPLFAVSAVVASWVMATLHWSAAVSRAVASLVVFAGPLAAGVVYYRRRLAGGRARLRSLAHQVGSWNLGVASVSLLMIWLLVVEFSYVADVRLERAVFSRTADPTIVVSVELGGAVSNPAPAQVVLARGAGASGAPEPLPLRPVGDGRYVAIARTQSLPDGDYAIRLTYPHAALSPLFPFFQARIDRQIGFLLVN